MQQRSTHFKEGLLTLLLVALGVLMSTAWLHTHADRQSPFPYDFCYRLTWATVARTTLEQLTASTRLATWKVALALHPLAAKRLARHRGCAPA
eukprot:10792274-Alexandrium_andersonii.AAC.1